MSSGILLYRSDDGHIKIQVRLENVTVWLAQRDMVELFQTTKQNISLQIKNIFEEGELDENSVVKEYLTTASDGKNHIFEEINVVKDYFSREEFAELNNLVHPLFEYTSKEIFIIKTKDS